MDRIEAEREASQHAGAVIARVVRDSEGRLVLDIQGAFPATGLRLLGPAQVTEGRYAVLIPASGAP